MARQTSSSDFGKKVAIVYSATLPSPGDGTELDLQGGKTGRLELEGFDRTTQAMPNEGVNLNAQSLSGTSPNSASTVALTPLIGLGPYRAVLILATLQGATGGTLDVYIQASVDGGTTWHDIVHFPQLAAGAAVVNYSLAISDYAQSSAPVVVGTGLTPALAANTVVGGSFGDRLRVVFKAGAGTTAGAAQTVSASFTT